MVEVVSLALQIRWPKIDIIATGKGEEGIELAASQLFDVVILDLGLPDINGFNCIKGNTHFFRGACCYINRQG